MERFVVLGLHMPEAYRFMEADADLHILLQTKTIETTEEALTEANNSTLPPLMNPTMLEASDDLTNLSHLNEPAGKIDDYIFTIAY
jgi:myosin heavy subunit